MPTKKLSAAARAKKVNALADDVAQAVEGAHYYVDGDRKLEVRRCLTVLDDGRAVLTGTDRGVLAAPADLRRIPTTAGDVRLVLSALHGEVARLADGDPDLPPDAERMRRLLTAVDVWIRDIPGIPDSEK